MPAASDPHGICAQARIKAVEAKLAAAQVEAGEASGARAEGSGYESVVWLACAAALNNERFPPGQSTVSGSLPVGGRLLFVPWAPDLLRSPRAGTVALHLPLCVTA